MTTRRISVPAPVPQHVGFENLPVESRNIDLGLDGQIDRKMTAKDATGRGLRVPLTL